MTDEAKRMMQDYKRKYMKTWRATHRAEIAAYQRAWRKSNPDKVRRYNDEYWQRKAEAAIEAAGEE